jgi:hypothetical protein
MRFHAADLADGNGHINAGHIGAGFAQHHGDARAGIGGAADDLLFALIRQHAADAQLVGIGVRVGLQDLGDGEIAQFGGAVHHLFDLEPEIGEGIEDVVKTGLGVEVVFQPREGELHVLRFLRNSRNGD